MLRTGSLIGVARPRPFRASTRVAGLLGAAALLLLASCSDERISLEELNQREEVRDSAPDTPVLSPSSLALAELHPLRLAPGDVLAIKMYGVGQQRYDPTLIEARVSDAGQITLPVVGAISVAGKTLREAEAAIVAAHVPKVVTELSVFVQLSDTETTTVLVMGAVGQPGLVELRRNERNVLYALARAGGYDALAAGGHSGGSAARVFVEPVRAERPGASYNLGAIQDVRQALQAAPLESGDLLVVDSAETSAVYLSGIMQRPGPISLPPAGSISVVRAIAAAGGLREYVSTNEATLVRMLPSGEQVQVKIPIRDVLTGKSPDLALRAGDVLNVPPTIGTFMQEWAIRNITAGPFSIGLRYDPLAQYNTNRALREDGRDGLLRDAIRAGLRSSVPSFVVPQPVP